MKTVVTMRMRCIKRRVYSGTKFNRIVRIEKVEIGELQMVKHAVAGREHQITGGDTHVCLLKTGFLFNSPMLFVHQISSSTTNVICSDNSARETRD